MLVSIIFTTNVNWSLGVEIYKCTWRERLE